MIKKVRIAVDHGNRNMKTCSQVFTTGLTIQDKKPARGEKFLFYEGKDYVLSENRIPYQRDKTHDYCSPPMWMPCLSSRVRILVIGSMMEETLLSWLMAAMK